MTTVAEIIEEYRKNHILITLDNNIIITDIKTSNIMEAIYLIEKLKTRLMFERDLENNKIEMVDLIKSLAEDVGKIIGEMQNKTEELENRIYMLESIQNEQQEKIQDIPKLLNIQRSEDFFDKKRRKKETK